MTLSNLVILGTHGAGVPLALACARSGLAVSIIEEDAHALDRAMVFAQRDDPTASERVAMTGSTQPLRHADFVFDATEAGFADHLHLVPDHAICATPRPEAAFRSVTLPPRAVRFVPFQPMQLRALTEITGFARTMPGALTDISDLTRRIGRVPVILPAGTPSIGLRLLDRLETVADQLLLEGAVLWELDEAMVAFGFDLGLYEAQDLTGLDVAFARRRAQGRTSLIADRAVQDGRIGKKAGWGWYRYPGGGGAVIDPLIEDLIREEAWFAKVAQRDMPAPEVITRLVDAILDEAAQIWREGKVTAPSDLDAIAEHGLGFPSALGGLVRYAAEQGRPITG